MYRNKKNQKLIAKKAINCAVQTNIVWANSKSNLNKDEYKEITKVYVIDTADTNRLEESSHK